MPAVSKKYLNGVLDALQKWDYEAAQRVDHFVANSKFIADRIQKYYHRKSTIIYPPIDIQSFEISNQIDDYFLLVSRLRPYKKVDLVIEAFNRLRIPLVVIGGGEEYQHLRALAKPHIRFLGEVPNHIRNKYLSRCRAFIHPQEEDFGISAVESMASGRPVIAYRSGGACETVLDGLSGQFFEEQSWEALVYSVLQFKDDDFDSAKIREHAMQFDASRFRIAIQNLVLKRSIL